MMRTQVRAQPLNKESISDSLSSPQLTNIFLYNVYVHWLRHKVHLLNYAFNQTITRQQLSALRYVDTVKTTC